MLESGIVVLWLISIVAAIAINLVIKPEALPKLLGIFSGITLIGGFIFYGIAFYQILEDVPQTAIRTLYATFRIMIGENDYGDIAGAPILASPITELLFWLLHLLGLITTAGAAITVIGSGLIRSIRLLLNRKSSLSIIYGVNPNTIAFGRELMEQEKTTVVYVEADLDETHKAAITEMNCIIRTDLSATTPGKSFLTSIGLGKGTRKLRLYALSPDYTGNEAYAAALLKLLRKAEVAPERTALTILTPDEDTECSFQAMSDTYGFGTVNAINEPEMAARLLVNHYPPCKTIAFDETGKATEDFHAVIIGFGLVGQAVLRYLTMNGQFEGSTFHAAIFAKDCSSTKGRLTHQYGQLLLNYDISFYENDGRSQEFYDYLLSHKDTLKYVAICTGNEALNLELEQDLQQYFRSLRKDIKIYRVSRQGVIHKTAPGEIQQNPIYCREILCTDKIDRMAMVLNHSYCGGPSPREDWKGCDYFSRMSSRASADFAQSVVHATGLTFDDVLAGKWAPQGTLLENLSKTEHLRWNAFHFAMGFDPMPETMFSERAALYLKEKEETGKGKTRISKDLLGKYHACLISWDALDALSQRENSITGGNVNYKDADRNNILAMGDVIREYLKAEDDA